MASVVNLHPLGSLNETRDYSVFQPFCDITTKQRLVFNGLVYLEANKVLNILVVISSMNEHIGQVVQPANNVLVVPTGYEHFHETR